MRLNDRESWESRSPGGMFSKRPLTRPFTFGLMTERTPCCWASSERMSPTSRFWATMRYLMFGQGIDDAIEASLRESAGADAWNASHAARKTARAENGVGRRRIGRALVIALKRARERDLFGKFREFPEKGLQVRKRSPSRILGGQDFTPINEALFRRFVGQKTRSLRRKRLLQ